MHPKKIKRCDQFYFLQLSFLSKYIQSNDTVPNSFVDVCQESFNIGDAPKRGPDTFRHEKARLWSGQVGFLTKRIRCFQIQVEWVWRQGGEW